MKTTREKRLAALLLSLVLSLLMLTACVAGGVPAAGAGTGGENTAEGSTPEEPDGTQTPETPEKPEVPPAPPEPPPPPEPTEATLAVCGDVMSHMPITNYARQEDGTYSYSAIMAAAEPYISTADFAVANLETTLSEGDYSGYPCFKSPDALAYNLKEMGFDLLMTSNNHSVDAGYKGVFRTLDVLDEAGLLHVGTSRTEEERENNIMVGDVGGISVAFMGYTYGTNGIPVTTNPFAVNIFNTDYLTNLSTPDEEQLLEDLEKAKALETDLIAVMIHWGVEYQTKQNRYQDRIADFLIANGADLVLGGHPHVLQPMEMRTVTCEDGSERTGFVCFSLGNFISNQKYQYTDTTVVLTLHLRRDNVTGETVVTDWDYVPMLMAHPDGRTRHLLVDAYAGSDEEWLQAKLDQAIADCHTILGPEHDPRWSEQETAGAA